MRKKLTIKIMTTVLAVTLAACAYQKETGSFREAMEKQESEMDEPDKQQETAEAADKQQENTEADKAEKGKGTADKEIQADLEENSILVEHIPQVVTQDSTYTSLKALEIIRFSVPDPKNEEKLSTESQSFGFGAAKEGKASQLTVDNQSYFDSLGTGALAWDNRTGEKVLYLTFDCGYEYENLTADMLDVLKEKEVPAAFFCTLDYLETAPEIAARMIEEGHIVGNHSTTHPADSAALSREEMAWEILGVENYLRVNFGYTSPYFRFPAGVYSENAMDVVHDVGFRNVFWSLAHADWDPENQPGVEKSFQTITQRLHPGAVILLHTTSPDNAAILADYIDYARQQGYTFRSLDEYPWE